MVALDDHGAVVGMVVPLASDKHLANLVAVPRKRNHVLLGGAVDREESEDCERRCADGITLEMDG